MTKLAADLSALANCSPAQLKARWNALGDDELPSVPPALLRRLLAQRLQERRHGALPKLVARELERLAQREPEVAPKQPRIKLTPGARLVREWNGQTITVEVLEDGFAWADKTWRSLSEIAQHVTGAHWSGPRFFGLTRNG